MTHRKRRNGQNRLLWPVLPILPISLFPVQVQHPVQSPKLTGDTSGARAVEVVPGAVGVEVAGAADDAVVVGEEAAGFQVVLVVLEPNSIEKKLA